MRMAITDARKKIDTEYELKLAKSRLQQAIATAYCEQQKARLLSRLKDINAKLWAIEVFR